MKKHENGDSQMTPEQVGNSVKKQADNIEKNRPKDDGTHPQIGAHSVASGVNAGTDGQLREAE